MNKTKSLFLWSFFYLMFRLRDATSFFVYFVLVSFVFGGKWRNIKDDRWGRDFSFYTFSSSI